MGDRSRLRAAGLLAAIAAIAATCGCFDRPAPPAASATPAAGPAPTNPVSGSGAVDVALSRVYVFVDKKGAGHQHGVEGRLSGGSVTLGRTERAGRLTFDMKSFAADTGPARKYFELNDDVESEEQAEISTTMRGTGVLDTANYPTAEFVIRSAKPLPPQVDRPGAHYQIDGDLILHGVSKPVGFTAQAETIDGRIRLQGTFSLKQTDFGIRPFKKLLGVIGVADELKVFGELWLSP